MPTKGGKKCQSTNQVIIPTIIYAVWAWLDPDLQCCDVWTHRSALASVERQARLQCAGGFTL